MQRIRVLIADDDPVICMVLERIVKGLGHEVESVNTAADAIEAVKARAHDLVLLDIFFPDSSDLSALAEMKRLSPSTDVIIVTAESDDLEMVAQAVDLGAFDYVPKPIREDDIKIRVARVAQMRRLHTTATRMVNELARGREFDDIISECLCMKSIVRQARELAQYDACVLVVGETGTGKELIARALHYGGPRRDRPFVAINCAAIPQELTESELFGHEKGSFTGAYGTRKGAFEEADDGTLFMDEIGDMNLLAQASLLRVLETGRYRTVGGREKTTNARIVFATNHDVAKLMDSGRFRKDLYYRVGRIRINVPPLRGRRDDIPLLAQHFLAGLEKKIARGVRAIAPQAIEQLVAYDWPGNVRELKNEIEQAYLQAEGDMLQAIDLSPELLSSSVPLSLQQFDARSSEEARDLISALKESGGNVTRAAEMLGIHRNTAWRWMKKYALERPSGPA